MLRSFAAIATLIVGLLQPLSFAYGQASLEEPGLMLAVRPGDKTSEQLAKVADKIYKDTQIKVDQFVQAEENNALAALKPSEIGASYVYALRLAYVGERLKLHGEPAGYDVVKRASAMTKKIREIAIEYVKFNRALGGRVLSDQLERIKQRGVRFLPQIDAMANGGKLEEAEAALRQILEAMHQYAVFVGGSTAQYFKPFESTKRKVDEKLRKKRRTALEETLAERRKDPKFSDLLGQIQTGKGELKKSGTAKWQGVDMAGPEYLESVVEQWQIVHLDSYSAAALDWAWGRPYKTPKPSLDKLLNEHRSFSDSMLTEVAAIIRADATTVKAEEAEERYKQYIAVLAKLAPMVDDAKLVSLAVPALDDFVKKNPALQTRVRNATMASTPVLNWVRNVNESQRIKMYQGTPLAADACSRDLRHRVNQVGFLQEREGFDLLRLVDGVSDVMRAAEGLKGSSIHVRDVSGIQRATVQATSRYDARTIATMEFPVEIVTQQATQFRQIYYVPEGELGMALQLAIAVNNADQGRYAAVGGDITELEIHPVITELLDQKLGAMRFLKLEPIVEDGGIDLKDHLTWRLKMTPTWAAHEYFSFQLQ